MSTCIGGWREEECPKYSKYPKNEQLPGDEQNPKVDSQESYIDSLKKRIDELEEEKRQLQKQLKKTDLQAGDIDSLQKIPSGSNDPRKEDSAFPIKKEQDPDSLIHQKDEEIKKMNQKINSQESEIDSLKTRIAELEKEVKELKGDRNILLIGEVCRKFQANLYQYVFPEKRISPHYSYKMAKLEQDIEKSKLHREKARELWKQLKEREHPEKFQNLVEELLELRNTTAHLDKIHFDVKDVLKAAEEVNEKEGFEFLDRTDFNFEDVKELIEMWARIDGYIN